MSKRAYAQASLFRRNKQEKSAISYTPGPNPELGGFVEEHAVPYDPAADDYNVSPFDKPITSTKATAIYNMHTYWSKKPHGAIQQYIRHYTKPGDMVLDPFCGSGGTALASLMEGRKSIAIDLSPAATFITKNYCTPVDQVDLQLAFQELEAKVKPEMDWLYETRCDRCDGRAITAYTIYSQVFQCSRCLAKVTLFECIETQGQTLQGKPKKIRVCPNCIKNGHNEEISNRDEKLGAIPVGVVYECEEGCKPKRDERYINDTNKKKRDYFQKYDLGKIEEIKNRSIPYWFPQSDIRGVGTRYRKDGLHILGLETVADLYTHRNLYAMALLRDKIDLADPLASVVTSTSLSASRLYRHRKSGGGGPKGTDYYIAPINREMNTWHLFENRWKNVAKFHSLSLKSTAVLVSTQTATNFDSISTCAIDYIFTDPPYSGTIQYGELNYVWECWLGFDTSWQNEEITVNELRNKTEADWARMMRQAISECYRVLKPGRWLSLCYHDTSEGTWELVQDIMAEAGFISERSEHVLYIDTGGGTYNQSTAAKATKRDLVINFRKPFPNELPQQLTLLGSEDAATFAEKARAILQEALESRPGSPTDRLYDELVSRMVRQRTFERHNFDELLRSVAEEVDGRWYLLETAGQVDAAESAKEEAAATHLETFMRTYLAENPGETGVHFSDLFEQNLYVQDKPRRDLKDWLPEYFFRTESGTWRPPANDEERAQKAALRSSGALRRIKRFGNALLEGVPPAQRDQPENLATAAEWLRQCRRAGLYELGRALFEKGGFNFSELDDEAYLEVEEDYQICVRRS